MKRHSSYDQSDPNTASRKKRHRISQTAQSMRSPFRDSLSDRNVAEDYRLATAKMPIDALSCVWRKGRNRYLNHQHVSKLCNDFNQGNLRRQEAENYLLVQCSAEAVSRMTSHLEQPAQGDQILLFEDWLMANPDEKAEVMTGQHRLEALRQYVKQTGADSKELWWTCVIYDRDRIPAEIDVKLRVNRRDLSLPDSHGQIWMQLVLASNQCDSLFQGKKHDMEKQMAELLRLSAADKLPTARLVTLWKNNRWRRMITRWCETRLGRVTFNISTWDWMASYRIDSYWFTAFEQTLETLAELPECVDNLQVSDWAKLAETLSPGHTDTVAQRLFYPDQISDESSVRRRQGFLLELTDDVYDHVYRRILERPELVFPDVQKLLKITKEEGRIMMQVLAHVVTWLNPNPTVIIDKRQNNKPLIREDLKPVIRERYATLQLGVGTNRSKVNSGTTREEYQAAKLEHLSIQLERAVLDATRDQMETFKSMTAKDSLNVMPNDDKDGYHRRFASKPWSEVLRRVEEIIGTVFSPSLLPAQSKAIVNDRHDSQPFSSIAKEIRALVRQIPEVAQNPALGHTEAYQELGASIDQAVRQWATRWCHYQTRDSFTPTHNIRDESRQPSSTVTRIRASTDQMNSIILQLPGLVGGPSNDTPLEDEQGEKPDGRTHVYSQISWPPFQSLFSRNE